MDVLFALLIVFAAMTHKFGASVGFAAVAAVYALMPYRRQE